MWVSRSLQLTCPSCIAVKRKSSLVLEPLCTAYQYTAPGVRSWENAQDESISWYDWLASYPGLFTTAFVARSTNVGEGLMYLDIGWMCGRVAHFFCTAVKWLSESEPKKHRQHCLMSSAQSFHGSCLLITLGMCPLLHTSTQHPGMSLHMISFTSNTVSDKHWGEKAWVQG